MLNLFSHPHTQLWAMYSQYKIIFSTLCRGWERHDLLTWENEASFRNNALLTGIRYHYGHHNLTRAFFKLVIDNISSNGRRKFPPPLVQMVCAVQGKWITLTQFIIWRNICTLFTITLAQYGRLLRWEGVLSHAYLSEFISGASCLC